MCSVAYSANVISDREPYVAQHGQVYYDGKVLTTRYLFQMLEELRVLGVDASRTRIEGVPS